MKRFIPLLALVFLVPFAAGAQPLDEPVFNDMPMPMVPDPDNPHQMLQYRAPVEPDIKPIKYLKQDPPASIRERVDRLLYGIKIDIPPEYDHYGYEIRRYMAHIGGQGVLSDEARLKEELANIRKAKIVHEYWRKELMKEIGEIEKQIEAENPSSDVRTSFKYNSGIALAFMTECGAWIQTNEKLYDFLLKKQGAFTYKAPVFTFHDHGDRVTFANYFTAAAKARKYINEYVPFAIMVY